MCKAQGARADSLSDRSPTRLRGGGRLDKRSRRLHEATSLAFPHLLAGSACLSRWQVLEITTGATKDADPGVRRRRLQRQPRSEEHTSELQSLMRRQYAVFCLEKKIPIY